MKKNKGFILILVLGFVLAFTSLVLFFNYKTTEYLNSLENYLKDKEMEDIGEIGLEIARSIIEKDKNNYDWIKEKWALERELKIQDYIISILVKDENNKINLNKIIEKEGKLNQKLLDMLKNLFVVCGYPVGLVDCLLDWIDEDSIPRASGAEEIYYKSIGLNLPPNKQIYDLKELKFVKGFNEEILYGNEEKNGLLNFITIYSDDKININTCEREILMAMGFSSADADLILDERERRPLEESTLIKINKEIFIKNKALIKYKSNFFKVDIKVRDNKGKEKILEGIFKKDKKVELIREDFL